MSAVEEKKETPEVGFELDGEFYKWSVSDNAKDLMLIDRFTQMPAQQFFELIEDSFDRGRGPILLAMIACSIRRNHPEWSVERVARTVFDLNLSDVTFLGGDDDEGPKSEEATKEDLSDSSSEKSNGSPGPASPKSPKTRP